VNSSEQHGRVIRAATPPRQGEDPEAREVLWMMSRAGTEPIRAELVALMDAIELELFCAGAFRRRWRFLRDVAARRYADRVKARLARRGYEDRRGDKRTTAWPDKELTSRRPAHAPPAAAAAAVVTAVHTRRRARPVAAPTTRSR